MAAHGYNLIGQKDDQIRALDPLWERLTAMLNATEPFAELPGVAHIRANLFMARKLLLRINTLRTQLLDPGLPGPSADQRQEWEVESKGAKTDAEACIRAAELFYDDWVRGQAPLQQ